MKLSRTVVLVVAVSSFLWGSSLKAQTQPQGLTPQSNQTDSAMTAQMRAAFQAISTNILKSAKEMPESAYDSSPVEGVRSFGDLVTHIAHVQQDLCENMNGHAPKNSVPQTTKENRLKALEDSNGECILAFSELSAQNADKMVKAPTGNVTHLTALVYVITHASEEYGQMSLYLRHNHLTPPTTDDAKGGGTEKGKS